MAAQTLEARYRPLETQVEGQSARAVEAGPATTETETETGTESGEAFEFVCVLCRQVFFFCFFLSSFFSVVATRC